MTSSGPALIFVQPHVQHPVELVLHASVLAHRPGKGLHIQRQARQVGICARFRSYPCRSRESAIKLAERFIVGVTKPARPAAQAETTPAPAAEPVAA